MRAVELIGCRVLDSGGQAVGTVHDLYLVADADGDGLAGYRLAALVTGSAGIGNRLGYQTGDVVGPWLLQRLFAWLGKEIRVVPWEQVTAIEGRQIRIALGSGQLAGLEGAPAP